MTERGYASRYEDRIGLDTAIELRAMTTAYLV